MIRSFLSCRLTSLGPKWGSQRPGKRQRPSWPKPASRRRSPSARGSLHERKSARAGHKDEAGLTGVVQDGDIVDLRVLLLDGRSHSTDSGNDGSEGGSGESHFAEVVGLVSGCVVCCKDYKCG